LETYHSASREDLGKMQVVAWTDDLLSLPRAKALLIEELGDLMEDDDGLVLPGDALIPLDKLMLRYLVSVRLLRSEDTTGGHPTPGPGGDRGDGGGGSPGRDRWRPPHDGGSHRGDHGGDLDQSRRDFDDRGGHQHEGRDDGHGEMMTTGVATAQRTLMAADACLAMKMTTARVGPLMERMMRSWRSCPKRPKLLTRSFC
jgi:hypothetical protein